MERVTFTINRQNAEPNATIKVNGEQVAVNKCVLALSSDYFNHYFFDERYPAANNIELPGTITVEDFKRLVAALPPEQRPLDDDCLEAVLILADRFAMDHVTVMCQNFLMACRKPNLYKFRIAHKYGWTELKEQILESIRLDDFGANYLDNALEFAKMDDDAKTTFTTRHAGIVRDLPSFGVFARGRGAAVRGGRGGGAIRGRWIIEDPDEDEW